MKHSENFAKVAAALVAVQNDLAPIGKDRVNPHFKNSYATLDAIIENVRPILASQKLALAQTADGTPDGSALLVETMLIHESGEWLSNVVLVPLQKKDPQGAGSTLTYGRRYGISALLTLATDEDDDGNAASKPSSGKRQSGKEHADANSERTRSAAPAVGPIDAATHMPIGKEKKGMPYTAFTRAELDGAAKWCDEKGKTDWAKHIRNAAANAVLGVPNKPTPKGPPQTDDEAVQRSLEAEDRATVGLGF